MTDGLATPAVAIPRFNALPLGGLKSAALAVAGLLAAGVAWQALVTLGHVSAFIVPEPTHVLKAMLGSDRSFLLRNARTTVLEILGGFGLSVGIGVPLGFVIASSRFLERLFYPLLVISQVVPKIAVGPLFLIWIGTGSSSKVALAFLLGFFPIVVESMAGFTALEQDKLQLARSMGAGGWTVLVRLRLPRALPHVFEGMKVSAVFCVTGAVVAEFIGANSGLGWAILTAGIRADIPEMYGAAACVGILSLIAFGLVAALRMVVVPWDVSARADDR